VDLKAIDAYSAAHNAERLLNEALDGLVFAFSSRNNVAGFRPQLPLDFEVTELQTGNTLYRFNSKQNSEILKLGKKDDRIIKYYHKLASSKNWLKDSIMRALSLFRAGYWSISISSQFRNYWIALEQLIDSAVKTNRSLNKFDYIPRLTITWRTRSNHHQIKGMLENVRTAIKANPQLSLKLSKSQRLKQWRNNPITIIKNTRYLLRNIRNNKTIRNNLNELNELFWGKKKRKLRKRIVDIRQEEELRVNILYAFRNTLTHKGITYFGTDKIYTQNMESLLIDVLEVFLSHTDAQNLDQIVRSCNKPLDIRMHKRCR
jgi:hypothetical protein